jgi:hypothetical protein
MEHAENRFEIDADNIDHGSHEGSEAGSEQDIGSVETENSEDFYASEANQNNVYVIDNDHQPEIQGVPEKTEGQLKPKPKGDFIIID